MDLIELRKVTYYDGYKQDDKTIQQFWQVKKKSYYNSLSAATILTCAHDLGSIARDTGYDYS